MYDRIIRIFAIGSIVLFIGVIITVVSFAKGKEKIYVSLDNYTKNNENNSLSLESKEILNIQIAKIEEADLIIPLMDTSSENDITVESDYQKHTIYITIQDAPMGYYSEHFVLAREGCVIESYFNDTEKITTLEIKLNDLYENQIVIKNGMLMISFAKPEELFDKIALIGIPENSNILEEEKNNMDEEELLLDIAKRVKSLFINSDVKIYILKIKEESLQNEEAIQFVTEINADMNVIIDFAKEETGIATYYNEKYYIPFFGNEQLADHIEYYTLKETEAPVLGIFPEKEPDSLLDYLEIPAARISIGNIWQEEGAETLDKEEYLNKVALGIYKGILESYKVMEEIEVE